MPDKDAVDQKTQTPQGQIPQGDQARPSDQTQKNNGMPDEAETVSRHKTTIQGKQVSYDAVCGNIWVETKEVKPAASVFHVDFVKVDESGKSDSTRPVTFIFNGGPGSSTTFLLMGSFGPRRIDTGEVAQGLSAPYQVVDNDYSMLPFSDLVFIDAPGAGFSDVADKAKKEIWSVDGDVAAFSQFIRRWCSKNHRWNSPKYLFGESYGTVRGAALALKMQVDGASLTGVTLISNILDYAHTFSGDDQLYIGYFPTFAATAHYHGKAGAGEDAAAFIQKAREFANGEYSKALALGDRLSSEDLDKVAHDYAQLTDLSEDYVKRNNLRVPMERFSKELLHEEDKVVGVYDGRVTGYDLDPARSEETYAADDAYLDPAYTSACENYLREELGVKDHRLRRGFADFDLGGTEPGKSWNWHHTLPDSSVTKALASSFVPFPRVIDDLACAISHEPGLKVLIGNGWYDLCTPMSQTEYDIDHLGLPKPLRANVALTYYPSGHMIYTAPQALAKIWKDLAAFYAADASQVAQLDERQRLPGAFA